MNKQSKELNNIQGIIFDIDGVLLDTESLQWHGWIEALKPYKRSLSKQQYFIYAGKQGDIIESEILKDFKLTLGKNILLEMKEEYVFNTIKTQKIKLMPYVKKVLKYFSERSYKIASASGSPKNEAYLKLEKSELLSFFDYIVTGSDVSRGKPHPDIYKKAAKGIKIPAHKCLAFEDTQYGVESAKSAGLKCIAVPNTFSKKQNFDKSDFIISTLKEGLTFFN